MKALRLGDLLVEAGKLTPAQLEDAMRRPESAGRPLGEVLRELGYIDDDDIARSLAKQLDIPFQELPDELKLEKEEVKLIPEAVARRYGVIALRRDESDVVTLVMKDPLDLHALDTIRSLTSLDITKAVSTERRILAVIDRSYIEEAHIERNLREIVDAGADDIVTGFDEAAAGGDDQLRLLANDAPVVRFVNLLLLQAVRDRASDIHFEPQEKDVHVRIRVDGSLREVTPPPKALYAGVVTRIKILSNMDISERRLPLDGRFKFSVHGRIIDVRVSSLPCVHGEKMVLRILDRDSLLVDMKDVGFEPDMLARFQRVLKQPHGIVLLTGPTGSGKTSTLYSALSYLRAPDVNIQTVEDPVEYLVPGINQMAIKSNIGLDFANALRAILRQDPDIIMIGEIRDAETAQIAMRAALTGHLVLSTLHTNDSPSAFWRLRDIGVEAFLIAATISLVISQRLVRVICEHCKAPVTPSLEDLRVARLVDPHPEQWTFMRGAGCLKCQHTGYRGRTAIFEFLEVNDPIREMVLDGTGTVELRNRAIAMGMQTLLANGLDKVRRGITTIDEVLVAAPDSELNEISAGSAG
ncbi:MAG TPA: ATPase, T2SS/T4P/T4SS family [Kiritimatiellia bacterium]|nr:ATPase, T2SS/T4P/T4SS family [Kiritimatiellia bacterium]